MTWNRDKKPWTGKAVKLRNALESKSFFGGRFLKRTWNRDKESWTGEAFKLRNVLECKGWGVEVLKMTWNRDKKSWEMTWNGDKSSLNPTKIVSESNDNSF